MMRSCSIFLFVLAFLLSACASAEVPDDRPVASQALSAEKQSEIEEELIEQMKAEEESFNVLSAKMDEYLDLLAVCDRLSEGGEGSGLKAACIERLKALKQELEALSALLQGQERQR